MSTVGSGATGGPVELAEALLARSEVPTQRRLGEGELKRLGAVEPDLLALRAGRRCQPDRRILDRRRWVGGEDGFGVRHRLQEPWDGGRVVDADHPGRRLDRVSLALLTRQALPQCAAEGDRLGQRPLGEVAELLSPIAGAAGDGPGLGVVRRDPLSSGRDCGGRLGIGRPSRKALNPSASASTRY